MSLERLTQETVARITGTLDDKLSERETAKLSKVVEQALVEAVRDLSRHYGEVAISAAGADADKAHKISEELNKAQIAIIANLQGLR